MAEIGSDSEDKSAGNKPKAKMIDVTKIEAVDRQAFIEKLIKHVENDNIRLLQKIRNRIDKQESAKELDPVSILYVVGVKLPTIEVRYKNLCVEADCELVHGKPLPTLWNSFKSTISDFPKLLGFKSNQVKISIIDNVSGVIKPGRMTLLLGPPGCGKTTLLKALSGNLSNQSLKVTGEVCYNGYKLEEFVPQKTSGYVSQHDLQIPEMTVRETLDFSVACQGVASRTENFLEVSRREKETGIVPDHDTNIYMKATSVKGLKESLQTDYILKILGLDFCTDTLVGDAMRRGISGGQKKRLTTGEMIVGPVKALFMDEITNGLDISTSFQIITCLQHLAHITDATILISLLQPSPETFDLFDDVILMAEGKILYHGPQENVLEFFENCGFRCPERKAVADFLQEVISKKDQEQYWFNTEVLHDYVSVDVFCKIFKESPLGKKLDENHSDPFDKSKTQQKNALSFGLYSLSRWEMLKVCLSRELLLAKRNYFLYAFKIVQLIIIAIMTMTVFLGSRMETDVLHANYYMGSLFYALVILLVDGVSELPMTVERLSIFYKQKDFCYYPAWAYAIPATILKIPLSLVESLVWTSLTYYVIGYSPQLWRFFRQFILLFAAHFSSLSMFRFLASVFQTEVASMTASSFAILLVLLFSGFVIPQASMPVFLKWIFWVCPMAYGEIGVSLNEFLAPRWQKMLPTNTTIGQETLETRGLNFDANLFWISLGALFGFALIFNIGFVLALTFFESPGSSRAIISHEKFSNVQVREDSCDDEFEQQKSSNNPTPKTDEQSCEGKMVLPFEPVTVTFRDVQYHVDTPLEMRERGFSQKKLQLLSDMSGALRPGVLTASMGVSGAGKTTLLDVLAGRKTSGYIEGKIKINGYPKVQETFVRISGYCEQTDIHSPQITVLESLIFSAWLRLAPQISSKTKAGFVNEVLETIELDGIKDALVGIPGVSGLSTEQRKRLTVAVELVANPSVIFMDEPTTGLDARAAAIVMRAVKNVADTGRTIVCTIHQPNIDIFEAFDELILLKVGGRIIYSGPLGKHSSIDGLPKIRNKYNPATWILEVTSPFSEAELGVDFAQIYANSLLYENNKELVRKLSIPSSGSKDLHFATCFSQSAWGQFKSCLWKQNLSYWRSPSYNLTCIMHTIAASLLFGLIFWNQGKKINDQQNLFNILGSVYTSMIFLGTTNCSSVLPYVASERTVMYREKSAGMYSSWPYALAQVIVEIPYVLIQAVAYVIITYPMIGYYVSVYKIFWNFYAIFCTILYFSYLGMLLVALTPNVMVASILFSAFYTTFNIFSGFLIPQTQIPKCWMWLYHLTPTSWTMEGLLTSQYGDINKEIKVFVEKKTIAVFLGEYFGFHHQHLASVAIALVAFPLAFASLFAFCIGRLNFQRR